MISKFNRLVIQKTLSHCKDNMVFSPASLYLALSMLAEASSGNTRRQILNAIGCDNMEALHTSASAFLKQTSDIELGNSLWLSDALACNEITIGFMKQFYDAEVQAVRFGTKETDRRIQNWLNEKTHQMLKDSAGNIHTDPSEQMELFSTICLDAAWQSCFAEEDTKAGIFHGIHGTVRVPMMHQINSFHYIKLPGFAAASFPFEKGAAMNFILPDSFMNPRLLLNGNVLYACMDKLSGTPYQQLAVTIPKFNMHGSLDVMHLCRALGMTELSYNADFTALFPAGSASLSAVSQEAMIEVSEKKVKASAYTRAAVFIIGMPKPPVSFVVNRPFLFTVTSSQNQILFAGIVNHL